MRLFRVLASLLVGIVLTSTSATAQVPHPKEVFGFMPGDDYKLARFDQLISYYKTLANTSDREVSPDRSESSSGQPQLDKNFYSSLYRSRQPKNPSRDHDWGQSRRKCNGQQVCHEGDARGDLGSDL